MKNIIIVEDNQYMQKHLAGVFSGDGFQVTALFKDAFEAERYCEKNHVDLVLMDVQTRHNHSGLSSGERIKKLGNIKIVVVTSLIDPEVLSVAKKGAADSLWYKDHSDSDLLDIVRRTLDGEHIFPDSSPSVELNDMFSAEISPRQMDILRRFVKGMTYEEIAAELKLSKNGVRWNIDRVMEKGGFKNKHELLAALIENKLIVTTLRDKQIKQ